MVERKPKIRVDAADFASLTADYGVISKEKTGFRQKDGGQKDEEKREEKARKISVLFGGCSVFRPYFSVHNISVRSVFSSARMKYQHIGGVER